MDEINLSAYDRSLLESLVASADRLAAALEAQKDERVLSCKEAASLLGRTPQTISRYLAQGRIKRGERGGRVGIPESELQKLKP